MNSDKSNCKESNTARQGGAANEGNHYPPTPESYNTTVSTSTTNLTTTTTKDTDNKKAYEDWKTQNKNKNLHKKEKKSQNLNTFINMQFETRIKKIIQQ